MFIIYIYCILYYILLHRSGLYVMKGQWYLEGEIHYNRIRKQVQCEIFNEVSRVFEYIQ
jgi:hypothetical protein